MQSHRASHPHAVKWDGCDAQIGKGVEVEPDWDEATATGRRAAPCRLLGFGCSAVCLVEPNTSDAALRRVLVWLYVLGGVKQGLVGALDVQ